MTGFKVSASNIIRAAVVLSMLLMCSGRHATADSSITEENVRTSKPLGAYLTLWGDPFPALLGANLAYNIYDFLRVNAGVGTDSSSNISATTFGGGVKLLVPKLAFTPVLGANFSTTQVNGVNHPVTMRGISHGGNYVYGNLGVEWQTSLGLNIGAGYNAAYNDLGGGTFYLTAGWYL